MKKRFKVEKLIRDRIPEILGPKNIFVKERIMPNDEYIYQLKLKLLEEAQEVLDSTNLDELIEEMADVFEVLHAIINANSIDSGQIEKKREEKGRKSGVFNRKIYCEYIEISPDNSWIEYYLKSPEKYPEIEKS
jgi:predicted house-cleaning noncanonical NTP pyrophosphatase (MazG superfamily)